MLEMETASLPFDFPSLQPRTAAVTKTIPVPKILNGSEISRLARERATHVNGALN